MCLAEAVSSIWFISKGPFVKAARRADDSGVWIGFSEIATDANHPRHHQQHHLTHAPISGFLKDSSLLTPSNPLSRLPWATACAASWMLRCRHKWAHHARPGMGVVCRSSHERDRGLLRVALRRRARPGRTRQPRPIRLCFLSSLDRAFSADRAEGGHHPARCWC